MTSWTLCEPCEPMPIKPKTNAIVMLKFTLYIPTTENPTVTPNAIHKLLSYLHA